MQTLETKVKWPEECADSPTKACALLLTPFRHRLSRSRLRTYSHPLALGRA